MGRPPVLRPQLRRDSLGSGGPAPVSVRLHFVVCFNCGIVIRGMRGASRRWRLPATPCGFEAARRAPLAAERRWLPGGRWRG